ncbi:condensation domain-containing protein, partial [Bacillus velezensis]
IAKTFIQPFELDQAPLFRAELATVSGKQYLMIDMHHIISDGVSISLLLKEFTKLYNGESLEPLRIQYKDFAQWQNAYLRSGSLDKQAAYWKKQFEGTVPVLHLPYDYERPSIQSFEGDSVHFTLDKEMTEGLRGLAKEEGATLHMVLLSAFNILLSKYSGQEDIVVGVPVAGRPHADLRNMIGMFVNTLAVRNHPDKEKT